MSFLLNCIICLPLLAGLVIAIIPSNYRFVIRMIAVGSTLVTMVFGVILFLNFSSGVPGYQFEFSRPWVPGVGISYHLGVDGINIGLILMGTIVAFAAACVSWEIKTSEKLYYFLLMLMTGGILGAFASLDMFFFYFFHELALVPTFIMIGMWGRGEDKNYATFNITLYLSLGALIALFGLIALYLQLPLDQRTFDIVAITNYFKTHSMEVGVQNFIFPLLMFGFGILVSLWPFHTWAPLGYGAAPTATAMLHAGVLKKFGLYGLLRIALPLMPQGARHWVTIMALLCLGNLLHVGWVAMRQRDLNLLIGNSSVAHMGFAFLGLASLNIIGVTGAVMVMVAHGLLAALSFGLSGYLYQQTGNLQMNQLGGLLRKLPFIGALLMAAMFAGCGLPGFANFSGEVLVLFGAWTGAYSRHAQWFVTAAAWGALVIGGIYMLRAIRTILHGPVLEKWSEVRDATHWRKLPFALLLVSLLIFGFFPRLLTDKIKLSAEPILKMAGQEAPVANTAALNLPR
ncbi:MAG TPA: NADH-quinone oxidoreductase subunit M [Candidatus Saccharimonadales bacterium]|nr:NADH-quinone oxidoreductase subunit M [Candidatus Saccharimonadales bacterium]